MTFSKAIWVSCAWIVAALLFNAGIYYYQGQQKALEFLTGYVIELSLSVDNLFVFYLIFSHFKMDSATQTRVLSLGILGAQLMRAVFILCGIALLEHLSWVVYIFGALLIISGFNIFFKKEEPAHLEDNSLLRLINRWFPKLSVFWVALITIELADLMFAVDSIPAVLAITKDPFIVYSSNIFAILGLRSMYFVLAPIIDMFEYLHYGLGVILIFVGFKMLLEHVWHVPIGLALGFIVFVLTTAICLSVLKNKRKLKKELSEELNKEKS